MKIILIPNNQTMAARHYCIAKELQAQGHEVTYFMWQHPFGVSRKELIKHAFTSLIPKTYQHETFTVHKAIRLPFFWPVINGWIFKAQLRKLFRSTQANLIITESYTNETEVPNDLPYIYDLADDYAGPSEVYGSAMYKFAFRLLDVRGVMRRQAANALAVTAVSSSLLAFAKSFNNSVVLVSNGVEKDIIDSTLTEARDAPPHSIIYATGFGPWSRAVETLETITALREEFPDITLTLVGAGGEVPNIKRYIEEHDASEYTTYRDYVYDRQELFALLARHAIGLNISDKNAWRDASHPMKVMDYSALGMRIVSTNLTEVENLGYENIYLFSDDGSRDDFKSTLQKALKDPRHSYKEIMDNVVTNYNWEAIVQSLVATAEQSLARRDQRSERIVHVTYAYPPAVGGLEQVTQQLAQSQKAAGLPVSVITSDKGCDGKEPLSDTLPVTRLRSFVVANTTIIPGLFGKLMKLKPTDTVHLHIAQAFSPEIVLLASKLRGFKYVAHVHLDVPPSGWAGFLLRIYKPLVLGKVLRDAYGVVVFTPEQKTAIIDRYNLKPENVHIVANGVANEYFIDKERSLHEKPRLLFVGRLGYQKNLTQLLDALEGVSQKFEITIVGDGELRAQLEAHARTLQLENITFAGFAQGEKLREYYKQADIFVLPSEREGMPLVLLEAMAAGLPIVATDVTGNKDVVEHGKNGILVPFGDAETLRNTLIELTNDNTRYQSMSRAASTMAQLFTWDAVREKFTHIYPKQSSVKPSLLTEATPEPLGRTFALPTVILPLLALAIAAYALPNIFGSIVTLLFFLTVPGSLLLRKVTNTVGGWWERTGLSVVLSLLVIMGGGLLLNMTRMFGVDRPLTTLNIFIMLAVATLLLTWFNRHARVSLRLPRLTYPSTTYLIVSILLTILPVLAIGGAIRLNNGASNILTMIMFGLTGLLTIVLIVRKDLRTLYPYALFMSALAVLLSTSLRGWGLTGHDIIHEYQVFNTVANDGFWKAVTEHHDPYSACLSITILPAILLNISHIIDVYIFKAVFQVIFALIAVFIYAISMKITNRRRIAFLTALIFILFPPFLNDMPFLNRQEIALLFFTSAVLVAFYRGTYARASRLVPLLLLGVVFSHYTTSYVTIGLLSISWVAYKIVTKSSHERNSRPLFGLGLIAGFFALTFLWNAIITQTSPGLAQTIHKTIRTVEKGEFTQANGVQYSLLSFGNHDPQKTLEDFVNNPNKNVKYHPDTDIALTPIGEVISRVAPVSTVNQVIRQSIAKLLQLLLLTGIVIMFVYYRKNKNASTAYVVAFTSAGFILLAMMVVLPVLSEKYSVTRMFQQILVMGGVPIVLASLKVFSVIRIKKPIYAATALFVLMFLHLSGFLPQITGGYPPQMALNNAGIYYDVYYHHPGEVSAGRWLDNRPDDLDVAVDTYGLMRFPNYPFQKTYGYTPPSAADTEMYLYQNYATKHSGAYAGFISGNLLEYTYDDQSANRSLLYTNQESSIYGPKNNRW